MGKDKKDNSAQRNRTICLPFQRETHEDTVSDDFQFGLHVDKMINTGRILC